MKKKFSQKDLWKAHIVHGLSWTEVSDKFKIASKAAIHFNVDTTFRHLDSTSMNVQGEYESEGIGLVKFGYSKDRRSDLKQFMMSLMSSQE